MVSDRTPVLVGAGAVAQREEEPGAGLEPTGLMAAALERAAADAGAPALLRDADAILVPRGMVAYADPGRLVADTVGADRARSVLFEIGVLQTSLFGRAARAIAEGEAEVVLVSGGEAKYREQKAARAGVPAPVTEQGDAKPDETLRPAAEIIHPLEIQHGLGMPVRQYAVMESALRHARSEPLDAHRRRLGELYAAFSRVAQANPDAWQREPVAASAIAFPEGDNRMLAFPYTKLHTAQWNVDQAAGLVFCSAARARREGIPESRWIHPRAVAESNHMQTLLLRRALHRSPGFALAGRRALASAGLESDDPTALELYSCFPVAVQVQALELGLDESRTPTVTGGMTFAGGPLNNFVLQAAVKMAQELRERPGHGLLTAVSGLMTKQGVSIWSNTPAPDGFRWEDVSDATARESPETAVAPEGEGAARVLGHTVCFDREGRAECAVAYLELTDGRRTLATSRDADWMEAMQREELNGRSVRVADGEMLPA
ncbi:MAG: acetyl-CoA acetyltransferase [Myxococcota bacterium]